jgi:hypothetical protein
LAIFPKAGRRWIFVRRNRKHCFHPDKNQRIFVRVIRRRRTIVRPVFCSRDIGTGDDWLHAQNVSGFCWDHPQTNILCPRTIVQNIKTCLIGQNIVSEQKFGFFYPQTMNFYPQMLDFSTILDQNREWF